MSHRTSHTHCLIVEPVIAIHERNYAGSRTKKVAVAESARQADMSSVCVIDIAVDTISTDIAGVARSLGDS